MEIKSIIISGLVGGILAPYVVKYIIRLYEIITKKSRLVKKLLQ